MTIKNEQKAKQLLQEINKKLVGLDALLSSDYKYDFVERTFDSCKIPDGPLRFRFVKVKRSSSMISISKTEKVYL